MKTSIRTIFVGAVVAACFATTLALIAQEPPPVPAKAGDEPAATAAAATADVAPANADVAAAPLRRLDAPDTLRAPDVSDASAASDTKAKQSPRERARQRAKERAAERAANRTDNEVVNVFGNSVLPKGETADAVIAVFGSATAEGDVVDAVVSVFGDSRVTGTVGDVVVAVMGNVYVNGHVTGDVVAVFGDIELGPDAKVDGQVTCVLGTVKRDAGAALSQGVKNVGGGRSLVHRERIMAWIHECLFMGRPLAFGPHLGWAWAVAGTFLALYIFLALLFREGLDKCVQTLVARPGASVLSAFLTVLISPVVMILLIVTGVGIFLLPFVGAALFVAWLFGTAVLLAWLGSKVTRLLPGPLAHPAMAVFLAGMLMLWLYTVPVLGFVMLKFVGWLGAGVVFLTLLQTMKRERPAPAFAASMPAAAGAGPMAAAAPEAASTATSTFGPADGGTGAGSTPPPMVPPLPVTPVLSAATLPRAGFWIRLAALALDVVLLAIIAGFLTGGGKLAMFGLAAYGAVLWKMKGTTIGGVICGLKVVRLDDRPIDWGTSIVRALGCFLSLAVAGLGFIWVAIDDQSQSWHDKIAGTTVVRVPKGVSLL